MFKPMFNVGGRTAEVEEMLYSVCSDGGLGVGGEGALPWNRLSAVPHGWNCPGSRVDVTAQWEVLQRFRLPGKGLDRTGRRLVCAFAQSVVPQQLCF